MQAAVATIAIARRSLAPPLVRQLGPAALSVVVDLRHRVPCGLKAGGTPYFDWAAKPGEARR